MLSTHNPRRTLFGLALLVGIALAIAATVGPDPSFANVSVHRDARHCSRHARGRRIKRRLHCVHGPSARKPGRGDPSRRQPPTYAAVNPPAGGVKVITDPSSQGGGAVVPADPPRQVSSTSPSCSDSVHPADWGYWTDCRVDAFDDYGYLWFSDYHYYYWSTAGTWVEYEVDRCVNGGSCTRIS